MKTPLERPALPAIDRPLAWDRAVGVFGSDARAFAERIAARLRELGVDARVLRVELRHAEGHDLENDTVRAHPSALLEALERASTDRITIGVGAAFVAAVRCALVVYVRGGVHPVSLSPEERELVRSANLVLEEPREATADAIADLLATRDGAPRL